jgi:hypothetical protein
VLRYRYALLAIVCGLILAGCVMPESTAPQNNQSEKVGAIQTRIAETRAQQAAGEEGALAGASDGAEEQTTTADETDSVVVVGPTAEQLELLAKLRPQGKAPELLNEVWLNSEPLKLADLRGQVVLVEFWTYG